MQLNLSIVVESSKKTAVVRKQELNYGLDFVKSVRQDLGWDHLPISKIKSYCSDLMLFDVFIPLDEQQAEESGKFKYCSSWEIKCYENQLNDFCSVVYYAENNETTLEIEEAGAKWQIDTEAIFQHWKNHGYPDKLPPLEETKDVLE